MSDVTRAFCDYLKAESTVTDLVGARVRTRWARAKDLRGSDRKIRPGIIVREAPGGEQLHHQGGAMDRVRTVVDVYCVAGTDSEATDLTKAAQAVLDGRPEGVMGRKNLNVVGVKLLGPARELDEPPEDGSDDWVCKNLLEFEVWHEQKVLVFA